MAVWHGVGIDTATLTMLNSDRMQPAAQLTIKISSTILATLVATLIAHCWQH